MLHNLCAESLACLAKTTALVLVAGGLWCLRPAGSLVAKLLPSCKL